MDFQTIWQNILNWLSSSGLRVILIIFAVIIVLPLARAVIRRAFTAFTKTDIDDEMKKRANTLSSLVRNIVGIVILTVAFIMILREFGIDIGPILAAAGIVGLAVGFGAQNLVQDVISGFFILLDDQIRVGDVVNLSGKGGVVEEVTLRTTVLRDLSGTVHYVRNGQIGIVSNMTKQFSYYVFDIGVAYREDTDEVVAVMKEVDESIRSDSEFKEDILEPLEILGVDQFADSAVVIKARMKTRPIKQWRIGREFNRLLKKKFDQKNIEMPFPHMTVYMGENKQGESQDIGVNIKRSE
jgi:small conductance mechanosensitive channel